MLGAQAAGHYATMIESARGVIELRWSDEGARRLLLADAVRRGERERAMPHGSYDAAFL